MNFLVISALFLPVLVVAAVQSNGKKEAMKATHAGHLTMQAINQRNDNVTIMNGDPRDVNCGGGMSCPNSHPICCTSYGTCCPSSHPYCLPNNLCGGAMGTLTAAGFGILVSLAAAYINLW